MWKGSGVVGGVGHEVSTYTAAGAIALTDDVAIFETSGAIAVTLADGSEGDRLVVLLGVDGGTMTLTANLLGSTNTLTFDNVGDSVDLLFAKGAWQIIGGAGSVAVSTV